MGEIFGPLSIAVRKPLNQPTIENLPSPLAEQNGVARERIAEAPGRIAQVPPPAAIGPVHEPIPGRPLLPAQLPRLHLVAGRSVLVTKGAVRQSPSHVGVGRLWVHLDGLAK